jgi:hypothetical protein
MRVVLHEQCPDADGEAVECPILQEPIAKATLDTFPRPFLSCHPTYSAMTLPCGHTFHAMALTYHWARSLSVLCPVCRAGPGKGQALAMSRLPCDWKYSMAARVRRERRRDRVEEEQRNRDLALQHGQLIAAGEISAMTPIVELGIRIEAQFGVVPAMWELRTRLTEFDDRVVFEVLPEELRAVPYPAGTYVRLVPYTSMHLLQPSRWFKLGAEAGTPFSVGRDGDAFTHVRLTLADDACLVADIVMAQIMGGGESFQLMMLENEI